MISRPSRTRTHRVHSARPLQAAWSGAAPVAFWGAFVRAVTAENSAVFGTVA